MSYSLSGKYLPNAQPLKIVSLGPDGFYSARESVKPRPDAYAGRPRGAAHQGSGVSQSTKKSPLIAIHKSLRIIVKPTTPDEEKTLSTIFYYKRSMFFLRPNSANGVPWLVHTPHPLAPAAAPCLLKHQDTMPLVISHVCLRSRHTHGDICDLAATRDSAMPRWSFAPATTISVQT